jgi:hypothetical protein
MSHLFTAIVAVALMLGTALTLTLVTLSSADQTSIAWASRVDRGVDQSRTALTLVEVDPSPASTNVDLTLRNTGQTLLRGFDEWDVFAQYYTTTSNDGLTIMRLQYTSSTTPSHGEWTDVDIYVDASSSDVEVYDPGVLNPQEEAVLRIKIDPAIPASTSNRLVVAAPNGVSLEALFTR